MADCREGLVPYYQGKDPVRFAPLQQNSYSFQQPLFFVRRCAMVILISKLVNAFRFTVFALVVTLSEISLIAICVYWEVPIHHKLRTNIVINSIILLDAYKIAKNN